MLQKYLLGLSIAVSWALWPQYALVLRQHSSRRLLQRPFSQTMVISVGRTPWRTNTNVSSSQYEEESASIATTSKMASAPQELNALLAYGFTDRQAHALLRKLKSTVPPSSSTDGAASLSAPSRAQQLLQDFEAAGLTTAQVKHPITSVFLQVRDY